MVIENIYTAKNGKTLILNPNERVVNAIRARLHIRDGFCPCRVEETEDTKCPCKDMRDEGLCCCKLYIEE